MYGNILLNTSMILGSILFVILFLAVVNLSKKIDNNKEKIKELESDSKVFCSGSRLMQIKLKDVVYLLLDSLGYDIIPPYSSLIKRQKNEIKNKIKN